MITNKSYLDFLNCEKKLWLSQLKNKEELPKNDFLIKQNEWKNNLVNEVVKRYENPILNSKNQDEAIESTIRSLNSQKATVFNALIKHDDFLIKIDLIEVSNNELNIILIKNMLSSGIYSFIKNDSSVKEINEIINEISFIKHILERCPLTNSKKIKFNIMALNSNYTRLGELDVNQLTKTFNVDKFLDTITVQENLEKMNKLLLDILKDETKVPNTVVGSHCKNPVCQFKDKCWKGINDDSIHNIPRITQTKRELFEKNGWKTIFDIPDLENNVTDIQRNVITKVKNGIVRKNQMKILFFLNRLKFPINHLDFETIFPNIPLYDGMKPMATLPFQYSLHIENKDKTLIEKSFIHEENSDPRLKFVQSLINDVGTEGSVLVFNKTFESGVLNDLALSFPEYANELRNIDSRLVDLMTPFKEQDYWHPKMLFSYSLKAVLPALVPEMSYSHLNIKNGEEALIAYDNFLQMNDNNTEEKELRKKIISDLKVYCSQDTLAMVKILEVIRK